MNSNSASIPNPVIRRLSLYLRQLESYKHKGQATVSSRQLGQSLKFTDAQVRKDFAYFGQFGHAGIGYRVDDLADRVRRIIGTDKTWNVALIGAGNLGKALLAYDGFDARGFRIAAVFDSARSKIGKKLGPFGEEKREYIIQPTDELKRIAAAKRISLVILAVPGDAAQEMADRAVEIGVRGILNFAPVPLDLPKDVAHAGVDLSVPLEQLAYRMNLGSITNGK